MLLEVNITFIVYFSYVKISLYIATETKNAMVSKNNYSTLTKYLKLINDVFKLKLQSLI